MKEFYLPAQILYSTEKQTIKLFLFSWKILEDHIDNFFTLFWNSSIAEF